MILAASCGPRQSHSITWGVCRFQSAVNIRHPTDDSVRASVVACEFGG